MDFSTMTPRILYSRVRIEPPEDSYSLDNWDIELRPIVKKAFNKLLNSSPLSRNENQWHRFAPEIDLSVNVEILTKPEVNKLRNEEFVKIYRKTYQELLSDILIKHSAIDQYFFSSIWPEMQNLDSNVAEIVLISLLQNDPPITALPIHDSFIVRRGAEKILAKTMEDAFKKITNARALIDRDETVYDPKNEKDDYPIINGVDIHEPTRRHFIENSLYHKREYECYQLHGLSTFD